MKTNREIVTDLLDNSPETVFSLWWLADTVGLRKGERTMPHTVREACRDYADRAGAEFYVNVSIDTFTEMVEKDGLMRLLELFAKTGINSKMMKE